MKRIALLTASALLLTACLGNDSEAGIEGPWQMTTGSYDSDPIPTLDSHPITITFDGDQLGGTAACNSYGGRWQENEGTFQILELSWTEMACAPPSVMESEASYLTALTNVESTEVIDGELVMAGSRTEMTFERLEPVPTAEMQATVWVLDGIIEEETVRSVSGERATLEFFTDGSFIGSTGCRTISGTYEVTGVVVQFTNFGADGDCSFDLADQDNDVISSLEGGFRVDIQGDRMTTWNEGDEGLTYKADA